MEQSVRPNETNCSTRRNKLFCVLKQAVYLGNKRKLLLSHHCTFLCRPVRFFRHLTKLYACLFGVLFLLRQSEGKLYSHLLKLFSLTSENPMNKGF